MRDEWNPQRRAESLLMSSALSTPGLGTGLVTLAVGLGVRLWWRRGRKAIDRGDLEGSETKLWTSTWLLNGGTER